MDGVDRMKKRRQFPLHESLRVGIFLALAGGMLDAHTYLFRGGVFANAQTGNLVLFGVSLAECSWLRAGYYLVPVAAFFLGVAATELLKRRISDRAFWGWRQLILLLEAALLVVLGCLPAGVPDVVVNVTVSFVCSLQVNAFRTLKGNAYATTMCTGNLRSAAEQLCRYWFDREKKALAPALHYLAIIGCFCAGAALGALGTSLLGGRALWAGAGLLLIALVLQLLDGRRQGARAAEQ